MGAAAAALREASEEARAQASAAAGAAISLRGKAALVKAGDRKGAQAAGRAAEAAQADVAASGGPAKVA